MIFLGIILISPPSRAEALRPATEHPDPLPLCQVHSYHPRVWFNAQNLALLQARWNDPAYQSLRQSVESASDPVSRALVYLATGDASEARAAINEVLGYGSDGGDGSKAAGRSDAAALVFDWCYDQLSSSERDQLAGIVQARMANYKAQLLDRFRWHEAHYFGIHPYLSCALAIEGEAGVPSELRDAQTVIQNLQELGDEVSGCGAYQPYFYQASLHMLPFFQWSTATDLDFASLSSFSKNVGSFILRRLSGSGDRYQRGPGDDAGDGSGYILGECSVFQAVAAYMIGNKFQDPLANWLGDTLKDNGQGLDWPCTGPEWLYFIYYNPDADRRSPDAAAAPLSKHFDSNGMVHLRSGWNIANGGGPDVRIWFYNGPKTEHSGPTQNHFTVWRGDDDLLVKGGNYFGSPSVYKDHYFKHAICTNTMLFSPAGSADPDREGGQVNGSGLQPESAEHYPVANELVWYRGETSYRGEIIYFDDTPLRTILSGDAGIAYDHDHVWTSDGSRYYIRDLVYLKHDVILIRDRFSVQNVTAVRALFHTREKPTPDQSLTVVTGSADAGILEGGARRLTIERGNSAAQLSVLWPANTVTRLVGGTGYEHWVNGSNSDPAEDCQGWLKSHWELPVRMELSNGQWRTEVEADPANADGEVLTAVLIGERGGAFDTGLQLGEAPGEKTVTVTRSNDTIVVVFPHNDFPYIRDEVVTCQDAGAECGTISDGRGGTLDCGSCTPPETCGGSGVPNQCGDPGSCTPLTCTDQPGACGDTPDGCGGVLDCGPCEEESAPEDAGCGCGSAGAMPWMLFLLSYALVLFRVRTRR